MYTAEYCTDDCNIYSISQRYEAGKAQVSHLATPVGSAGEGRTVGNPEISYNSKCAQIIDIAYNWQMLEPFCTKAACFQLSSDVWKRKTFESCNVSPRMEVNRNNKDTWGPAFLKAWCANRDSNRMRFGASILPQDNIDNGNPRGPSGDIWTGMLCKEDEARPRRRLLRTFHWSSCFRLILTGVLFWCKAYIGLHMLILCKLHLTLLTEHWIFSIN